MTLVDFVKCHIDIIHLMNNGFEFQDQDEFNKTFWYLKFGS